MTNELNLVATPQLFDMKCDGSDETEKFRELIEYCIQQKKPLYIPSGSVIGFSNIEETIPTDNGLTIYGDGIQSKLKIIGSKGLKLIGSGDYRNCSISDISIEGNPDAEYGIYMFRVVRPTKISNIIGRKFLKSGASPIIMDNCINAELSNIYTRENARGIKIVGQSDAINIYHCTNYEFTEYGISIENGELKSKDSSVTKSSVGVSIYEPYNYGTKNQVDNTGKTGIYCEDANRISIYGGWSENIQYAYKFVKGKEQYNNATRGCTQITLLNPKRGGNQVCDIVMEGVKNSFIYVPNFKIQLDSTCKDNFIIANNKTSITGGNSNSNYIFANDRTEVKGPIKSKGMYLDKITLEPNTVQKIGPIEDSGVMVLTDDTDGTYGMFAYKTGAFVKVIKASENVEAVSANVTGETGKVGKITIGTFNEKNGQQIYGYLAIENRSVQKNLKLTLL